MPEACPVDSGRAAGRDAKRRVVEVIRDLRAALDEGCGAEGWRRPSRRAPRSTGARRRRPVGGTSLLKVAARTPFPSAQRRDAERGCGREGDRGAAAHRGRFPPPCRTLPARRVARGPPVAWACAEHFLCLGRARDGRTIDCSFGVWERCRNGLFVEARAPERARRGSSDFARRPKVVSAPAGRVPYRRPRLRRRASAALPARRRFLSRACPKPPDFAAAGRRS